MMGISEQKLTFLEDASTTLTFRSVISRNLSMRPRYFAKSAEFSSWTILLNSGEGDMMMSDLLESIKAPSASLHLLSCLTTLP
jgi:hypothetical protein